MWNVDLTEWDGIEVEVIDESDLISDLQEVIIDLRFSVPSLPHLYMEHEVTLRKYSESETKFNGVVHLILMFASACRLHCLQFIFHTKYLMETNRLENTHCQSSGK